MIEGYASCAGKLEKQVNSAGGESKLKQYVFTHMHFDIAYNGNRIVVSALAAALVSDTAPPLHTGKCTPCMSGSSGLTATRCRM
jgi:hypothetical protein